MITPSLHRGVFLLFLACSAFAGAAIAGEHELQFQATLVWGCNDPEPDDSELKPVEPAVARKLATLPFKWKYYYTVECKEFAVAEGGHRKVRMSDECEIVVHSIDEERVELALRGQGRAVGKVTQKVSGDHMLVTGGNSANFTAWFVVLRRTD